MNININDAVIINPHGCGKKHVGIVNSVTNSGVLCKEWYGITHPNLVTNTEFSKNVVQKTSVHIFDKAKKLWKDRYG